MPDWNASAGHAAEVPAQISATSHAPADARHVVEAGRKTSSGHLADMPVQTSARSQSPAAARQVVPAATSTSTGQSLDVPVHFSAVSHVPAAARHVVVAGSYASSGQAGEVPVHFSSRSQPPCAARQTVEASAIASRHSTWTPSHVSATSHAPADARHVPPAGSGVHTPSAVAPAAALHAAQSFAAPPPQEVSQHTPSTQ